MNVRRAEAKDIPGILDLLIQVDMVHHLGRPDLFKGPATKYNAAELEEIIKDDKTPVFVCVDDNGLVAGHAFCIEKQELNNSVLTDIKTLYIDDICVDENSRGQHVATGLFEHVKTEAKKLGCYELTLNVWEGNDRARNFYEKMGLRPQKTYMEYIL